MKNKHNDSTKAFEIDNSANVKDNKKGFRIVIENLDTGERVVDSRTRAIIGAFENGTSEEVVATQGIIIASCNTKVLMDVIEAADKTIVFSKKRVINDFFAGGDIEALLKSVLGDSDE